MTHGANSFLFFFMAFLIFIKTKAFIFRARRMPYLHSTRQKGFDGPTGAADTMIQEICGGIINRPKLWFETKKREQISHQLKR
jgi:hypothetical protein